MVHLWSRIQTLKGETLFTVARSKPFTVVEVTSDRIIFVPQGGSGAYRWVSREQIEKIYGLARGGKEIRPSRVQEEYPNDQNTSYIAAIVKHLLSR